jgi:1-acyl-sn-glycerol-3-phosphate acyltransferase
MLVANHRSFFDFFSIAYWFLISRNVPRKMFFPVRSNFFYESFFGVIVTGVMGAWGMFPPIFRDKKKKIFNRYAIERIIYEFRKSPSLIGFHPEGKRNKEKDPYSFLEARAGLGHVLLEVEEAVVLPLFIYGLSNSMGAEFKRNWSSRRMDFPIHLMFGPPIDLARFQDIPKEEQDGQEIAEECMKAIRALAEEHRQTYNPSA